MKTSRSKTRLRASAIVAGAMIVPAGLFAAPAMATDHATVSVLHAIPAGLGADVVDVYAGDSLLIDDFTPGSLETLVIPAGSYDLGVYGDGSTPADSDAVLSAMGVEVPAGVDANIQAVLCTQKYCQYPDTAQTVRVVPAAAQSRIFFKKKGRRASVIRS